MPPVLSVTGQAIWPRLFGAAGLDKQQMLLVQDRIVRGQTEARVR